MERIPLYQKEYLQLQRQLASRIEELQQEINKLINDYRLQEDENNKQELNKLINDYRLQIEEINKEQDKLRALLMLNLCDSTNAIAYFASLMEKRIYDAITINTILCNQEKCTDEPFLYNVFYLVERNQKDYALLKILQQFPITKESECEYVRRNICLKTPSEHYIQISYKKCQDIRPNISYYLEKDGNPKPKMCDPKFAYILDYIDTLIMKQLEERRWISNKEMIEIAMEFASQKEKSKVKI